MADALQQFDGQTYINLETRKRSGTTVATPVWFVTDGRQLFVRTEASSGKVKRVRNDPRVRVAACTANGVLKGDWLTARASLVDGPEASRVHGLFLRKYGLTMRAFDLLVRLRRNPWATLAVTLESQ
jgi:PPOX class probable F420-dependent enzyme